ncbi:TolC family protein [Odoribacter sp. Z80]|uniref:TolC family protein n=1 Tax=Odoribacter sp. Z80 TaxID=2304575 RepID=UPI00137A0923|nr:TolC family protein [Odoribacter sp. Z80]NCE72154.1 TolC family protein [Odoribacter sp. Z80]
MLKQTFILVFLFFSGMSHSFAQEILTLDKALSIAFEHSPSLIQSKLSLEQRELNLKAQDASLKSQFSLDINPFNYTRNNQYDSYNSNWYANEIMSSSASLGIRQPIKWTDGTISLVNDLSWQDASNKTSGGKNTSFNHNLSLRLEQPLFTYNRTKMQLKELEYALENAKLSYAMQELNIEKNVTTQFYSVYQKQKDLNTARDEYHNQKQNYDIIKNKVEAGLVAREELYQAEVNLATSESSVYSAEIDYENSKDNFKLLLGISLDEDIMVLPNTDIVTVNVNSDDATKYALEQRMELRQKQITLEQDVFNIIRAKAENEFKGNLSARIAMDALSGKVKNLYDNPTDNEQIGISLTIPIFDWGAKKAKVKSSQLAMESNQIDMDEEKKNITIGVRQICRNLPILIRQIEIKKKSIENAEHSYEINLEKYRNGTLTGMELQQYQTQLTNAKQAYTNAVISYKLEVLNLKIQTLWDFESNKSYLPVDLLK